MRIGLLDTDVAYTTNLRLHLEKELEIEDIVAAESLGKAIQQGLFHKLDTLVVGANSLGSETCALLRLLASLDCPILVLGRVEDLEEVLRLLKCGAAGYLSKDVQPQAIAAAINALRHGIGCLTLNLARQALEHVVLLSDSHQYRRSRATDWPTPRELDILALLAAGLSNAEIAGKLHISTQTVKNHLTALYKRLGVNSRTQVIKVAVERGWVSSWVKGEGIPLPVPMRSDIKEAKETSNVGAVS